MPVIGGTLTSATIDATKKIITAIGSNFGEIEYPVSDIQVSLDGIIYTSVASIDSWANGIVVGSVLTALSSGTYYVRVITSDKETLTLASAFIISNMGSNFQEYGQQVGQEMFNR